MTQLKILPKFSFFVAQNLLRKRWLWLGWVVGLGVLSGQTALAQVEPIAEDLPASAPSPLVAAPENPVTAPPEIAPPDYSEPVIITPKTAEAPLNRGDAFIDRTDYNLGATQREQPVVVEQVDRLGSGSQVASESAPVTVAPRWAATVSSSGIGGWNPGSTTPVGREYSAVRDYYNRTVRPVGRLANNIRLIFPLAIPSPITSLFGWRVHPLSGDSRFHAGTDLGAPLGTPVLAAYTGQVALADFFGGYGLAIALSHNQNTQQTLYAHLSEIFVKPGEWVQQGTAIGRVGSTGASTGPHLHFEFRQLTTEGWVAMDAGTQLETSLAELVKVLQVAQATVEKQGK
ncbi:MAG: M23 family metallopeptidase [Leptolyngbyaceae cyanobacterium CSU_1_3]|nr:M23 family metallopeptidase [Leptolyngbyaceae cyanobacterium CSU_1_3]